MYSFYRAWLMRDAFTSSMGNPPDVLLHVGPSGTQFAAHRAVLAAQSGYFKSIFAHPSNPVIVANVDVPEFTSLLTWMYTGYMDLNLDNIYNILLATHMLHMPNALEICRNFLVQNNHLLHENRLTESTSTSTNLSAYPNQHSIIKPIASRKFLPDTFRFEPTTNSILTAPPPQPITLKTTDSTTSSFRKIDIVAPPPPPPPPPSDAPPTPKSPEKIIEIEHLSSPKPSTSFRKSPSPTGSLSPNFSESSDTVIQYNTGKKSDAKKHRTGDKTKLITADSKVVVDIACCDGPVRFHRVLNNCYGLTNVSDTVETATRNKTDIMNKIMTETITRDENNRKKALGKAPDETSQGSEPKSENSQNEVVYTCVYCNHTFKSQYCYQKHARRHINPVTLNSTCKVDHQKGGGADAKREVKLLDMNVQYYPCKTCGSKFPSYYFVHKHRKMYHAEEMVGEKDAVLADTAATGSGAVTTAVNPSISASSPPEEAIHPNTLINTTSSTDVTGDKSPTQSTIS